MLLHRGCNLNAESSPCPVLRDYFCSELLVPAVSLNKKKTCSQFVLTPFCPWQGSSLPAEQQGPSNAGAKPFQGCVRQNPHVGAGHRPPQPQVTEDSRGPLPQEAGKQRAGTRGYLRGVCTRDVPMLAAGGGQEDPLDAVAQGRRGEMVHSSCPASLQLPPGPQTHTHPPTKAAAQPGEVYLQSSCTGHSEPAGIQPRFLQQLSRDFPSTLPTRKSFLFPSTEQSRSPPGESQGSGFVGLQ